MFHSSVHNFLRKPIAPGFLIIEALMGLSLLAGASLVCAYAMRSIVLQQYETRFYINATNALNAVLEKSCMCGELPEKPSFVQDGITITFTTRQCPMPGLGSTVHTIPISYMLITAQAQWPSRMCSAGTCTITMHTGFIPRKHIV